MKHTLNKKKSLILVLILLLVLAACRQDDEDETPTPLPATATTVSEIDPTPDPEPTMVPDPTPIAVDDSPSAVDTSEIDWPPSVVFSSPAPGEKSLLSGAVTIRFDQPMDQASVERAFSITSADGGEPAGTFQWPRPDTLIFVPENQLKRAEQYKVTVAESATGENGESLEGDIELDLQTIGFLEVSQVLPADGTRDVQTDGAITVLFNRPVVPLVTTDQQAGLPNPLTITPDLDGEGSWISTSIYRFEPAGELAGATTYNVTINEGLEDITGGILENDLSWSFTTFAPTVIQTIPRQQATQIVPTDPITVTFNMPMDRSSTQTAFGLTVFSGSGDVVPDFEFSWSEGDRVLTATPNRRLSLETSYDIVIGNGALSANGEAALENFGFSRFTTVPFPAVRQTSPNNNETVEPIRRGINIVFASPMDFDTIQDQIIIDPAPEEVEYFAGYDSVSLSFDLEPRTNYQVTVPASVADPYGNTIGQPYTWVFTTEGLPPLVSLNLPVDRIAQFSQDFPTEIDVAYRNIRSLRFELYTLGIPYEFLLQPQRYESFAGDPTRIWQIDTPQSDTAAVFDLQLADGGTLPNGIYYLQATAPGLTESSRYWQNQGSFLVVADTNLVVKETFGAVHVWATDLATGLPVSDRTIQIFNEAGNLIGSDVSNGDGLAEIPYQPDNSYLPGVIAVTGNVGEANFGVAASNWAARTEGWSFGLANDWGTAPPTETYIFTDRPIYRPGDTLYFQGYVRNANNGRYSLPEAEPIEILINPNFFSGEDVNPLTLTTELDAFGGFTGSIEIPDGYPVGTYGIQIQNGAFNAYRQFTVAEYRAPEFLVTVLPDEPEALRGETVDVVIEASYFFGGPASDLRVAWNVTADNYILPYDGPFYSFIRQSAYFYDPFAPGSFGGQWLMSGEGLTDEAGKLVVTLPSDLLEELEPGSRTVTVEATVFDVSEFPVVSRSPVVFHAAEQYVGVVAERSLVAAGEEATVDLLTTDWAAEPAGNIPVEVIFYRREWQAIRNNDFGQFFTRWEPIDTEVDRAAVTSDARGEAVASFVPPEGGSYYIEATLTDSGGRQQTSSTFMWALDPSFAGWRTDPSDKRMDLTGDKSSYNVGDTANILVQSPFAGETAAWVTIERGGVLEQYVTTLSGGSDSLNIPITEALAPNVFVTVVAIKEVNGGESPFADIRLGLIELIVDPEPLSLNIDITPQATRYEPQEEAVFDIRVTDYLGSPVRAEVTVSLVDLAVLTLTEDNAPDILDAFYYRQPLRSRTGSGLFLSGEGLELEIPEEQFGLGGGGGGDAVEESAFALADEDGERGTDGGSDVRSDFRDTAYWEAQIQTDGAGQATVTIPLPDNLTTWRLSAKAITAETLVGQNSGDIVVTKPVLLRPVTPRFFTFGDRVFIGTIVNNNTADTVDATVTLEAEGVAIIADAEQTVAVAPGAGELVRWEVVVENVDFVDLTFRMAAGDYTDATKPTFGVAPDQLIPVYRFNAEDIVGTAGVLQEIGRRVEAVLLPDTIDPDLGDITVTLSPSLAAALIEALEFTRNYDYDPQCAGGLADRLMSTVAIARAIALLDLDRPETEANLDRLIPEDIARLENLVKFDGGWGWCYATDSQPWLTAYVLLGLAKAEEAGYAVDKVVLTNAIDYLSSQLNDPVRLNTSSEVNAQAFYIYVLSEAGATVNEEVVNLAAEQRGLLDPYAKALLIMADGDGNTALQQTLISDLGADVVLSATGAHWEDESRDYRNLSSNVRGTAMVINALAVAEPDNLLGPQAVRWLMSARTAGHWASTHETAWTIFALTDWMIATDEANADFEYALLINGDVAANGAFGADNLAESVEMVMSIDEFVPEAVNYFDFQITEGDGRLYYTMHLDAFVDANAVNAVDRGFSVQRIYYDAACDPEVEDCAPITEIAVGQQVRVELTIITENDRTFVMVEDYLPAGAEGIDPNLNTTSDQLRGGIVNEDYRYGYWGWWYFNQIQFRDDRVVFFSNYLPAGTYQYTYFMQATIPGEFQVRPTLAREDYFPEVFGRSDGVVFTINE